MPSFSPRTARCLLSFCLSVVAIATTIGCNQSSPNAKLGDGSEATASADGKLNVVCTTSQVADIARRVGGERVQVTAIMGPGVDPHLHKASPRDIDAFNGADIIFYSGLHLEGRLADLLVEMADDRPTIAVTQVLRKQHSDKLREPEEFEGHYDPHVWFDPTIWVHCVQLVGEELGKLDAENANAYTAAAKDYQAEILATHEKWKQQLASIPESQRVLVTAHDAFGYFGNAYGIEVRGLQGISTADETDLTTVGNLVDLLVSRKIKAVFVESSVASRNVQSLVENCQNKGHTLVVGGELFSDAMGSEGTSEGTYIGMMNHNVRTIVEALK